MALENGQSSSEIVSLESFELNMSRAKINYAKTKLAITRSYSTGWSHCYPQASSSRKRCRCLFDASHGTPEKESVWNYLVYGSFDNSLAMKEWMKKEMVGKSDPLTWTVFQNRNNTPVGIVALLAIVSHHGRAEIGHVWFTPAVHKTKVNTESQFLLLRHLFERHLYRRCEWRCNSLNHASRTTASRMGFIYEGRFRQHMVVRGKNRDTIGLP